jgi:hypothetical protein
MGAGSFESARDNSRGRSPRTFRVSALGLLLGAAPLAFAWSTGAYGQRVDGVDGLALNSRWLSGWLVPACVAAVLAYGTAQIGVDHRVAAAGVRDIRTRWWSDHLPAVAAAICSVFSLNLYLADRTGEPYLGMLVPSLVGVLVAIATAHVVVTRWGTGPGFAFGSATAVTCAVLVLPYFVPAAGALVVDPTLARWTVDGLAGHEPPIGAGTCLWLAAAGAAVLINRLLPADVSGLAWIAKEAVDRD